jgi:hypothetical protein
VVAPTPATPLELRLGLSLKSGTNSNRSQQRLAAHRTGSQHSSDTHSTAQHSTSMALRLDKQVEAELRALEGNQVLYCTVPYRCFCCYCCCCCCYCFFFCCYCYCFYCYYYYCCCCATVCACCMGHAALATPLLAMPCYFYSA